MASTILEYVVLMLWTLFTQAPAKLQNPAHAMIFTTADVVRQLLLSESVTFAQGLLAVLQAATPPSTAYFKTLPAEAKSSWGVYLLVLEKDRCRPRIYVGSGTHTKRGVETRLEDYDLPKYVKLALDDGYTIVHKGLLCWAPIPVAGARYTLCALMLALENMFSLLFWAMQSRTADYGMPHICPWSLNVMTYDGLCSHVAIMEGIRDEEDGLSLEEIAAKELELEWREKERQSNYAARLSPETRLRNNQTAAANAKASLKYACELCGTVLANSYDLNLHNLSKKHLDNVAGTSKVSKNVALKKHYCRICDRAFKDSSHLNDHYKTQKHIKAAAAAADSIESDLDDDTALQETLSSIDFSQLANHCELCNVTVGTAQKLTNHMKSKKHLVQAAAVKNNSKLNFSQRVMVSDDNQHLNSMTKSVEPIRSSSQLDIAPHHMTSSSHTSSSRAPLSAKSSSQLNELRVSKDVSKATASLMKSSS
jgi:hypothetical protein